MLLLSCSHIESRKVKQVYSFSHSEHKHSVLIFTVQFLWIDFMISILEKSDLFL